MAETFTEPRPTSVTVIGWAWIVVGSIMFMSASLNLIMQFALPLPDASGLDTDAPFATVWKYMWLLALVQIVASAVGVFAGIRFLALHAWARTALELLSWLMMLALVGFAVAWAINFSSMGEPDDGSSFGSMFAAAGALMTVMYGVPFGLMVYHLRGAKVRAAVKGAG